MYERELIDRFHLLIFNVDFITIALPVGCISVIVVVLFIRGVWSTPSNSELDRTDFPP